MITLFPVVFTKTFLKMFPKKRNALLNIRVYAGYNAVREKSQARISFVLFSMQLSCDYRLWLTRWIIKLKWGTFWKVVFHYSYDTNTIYCCVDRLLTMHIAICYSCLTNLVKLCNVCVMINNQKHLITFIYFLILYITSQS